MTEVTLFRNNENQVVGFEAHNHSGFDEAGDDIVCSSITTVFEVARAGTEDLDPSVRDQSRADGDETRWQIVIDAEELSGTAAGEVLRLFEACRRTLERIAEHYPDHCSIEVQPDTHTT